MSDRKYLNNNKSAVFRLLKHSYTPNQYKNVAIYSIYHTTDINIIFIIYAYGIATSPTNYKLIKQ